MRNWLNNKVITKEIDGTEVKFRRVPVGTLQKFRFLAEDVSRALALLFKDTSHDIKVEQRSVPTEKTDGEGAPYMSTEYVQEAAHPSNIQLRKTQLEEGIKGMINAVTAEESLDVLCEIIRKSAFEEEWPEDADKMKEGLPLDIMIQFLQGAFEASAGDFASLGKSLFQKNPKIKELLDQAVEGPAT